jgi:hypothetical protein
MWGHGIEASARRARTRSSTIRRGDVPDSEKPGRTRKRRSLKNRLIKTSVQSFLGATASLCSRDGLERVALGFMSGFGRSMALARGVRPQEGPLAIAETWQRAFPSKKEVPIVRVDETTAYAEIHTPCPLRGSGDVRACYRMMAYDRAFAARAGGTFVVLRSQAEPGVTRCEVALRSSGLPHDDLVPAHELLRRRL